MTPPKRKARKVKMKAWEGWCLLCMETGELWTTRHGVPAIQRLRPPSCAGYRIVSVRLTQLAPKGKGRK